MKQTSGHYDAVENILHIWHEQRVDLVDERSVATYFDEVLAEWIRPRATPPYLLVNYQNVRLSTKLADVYAKHIGRFQSLILGTFRYNVSLDFTGVAVTFGNMKLMANANIYPDEASAREAIKQARGR